MPFLLFHPFASVFDDVLHDSLFFSGSRNHKHLSSQNGWHQPCLGVRLQKESDKAFVYAIDAPGIIQTDEWRLNIEKTKQETVIRLIVGQSKGSAVSDRRLFSVGSNGDSERISARLSDHTLTITVPKKQKE